MRHFVHRLNFGTLVSFFVTFFLLPFQEQLAAGLPCCCSTSIMVFQTRSFVSFTFVFLPYTVMCTTYSLIMYLVQFFSCLKTREVHSVLVH